MSTIEDLLAEARRLEALTPEGHRDASVWICANDPLRATEFPAFDDLAAWRADLAAERVAIYTAIRRMGRQAGITVSL